MDKELFIALDPHLCMRTWGHTRPTAAQSHFRRLRRPIWRSGSGPASSGSSAVAARVERDCAGACASSGRGVGVVRQDVVGDDEVSESKGEVEAVEGGGVRRRRDDDDGGDGSHLHCPGYAWNLMDRHEAHRQLVHVAEGERGLGVAAIIEERVDLLAGRVEAHLDGLEVGLVDAVRARCAADRHCDRGNTIGLDDDLLARRGANTGRIGLSI